MSQTYENTGETLEAIERHRKELLVSADERIETLQHDLQKAKEWRDWCAKAAPVLIHSTKMSSVASDGQQRKDDDLRSMQLEGRIRDKENSRSPLGFLIAVSVILFLGLEWFASTSYKEFCYRLGDHIISALLGGIIFAAVIVPIHWIRKFRGRE
jgi:hypothetical protein